MENQSLKFSAALQLPDFASSAPLKATTLRLLHPLEQPPGTVEVHHSVHTQGPSVYIAIYSCLSDTLIIICLAQIKKKSINYCN